MHADFIPIARGVKSLEIEKKIAKILMHHKSNSKVL
jgi:hypothetical protein